MLNILLSFISECTQKFINPNILKYKNSNKCLKSMVKIVMSYSELSECLFDFRTVWNDWLKSDYNHKPYFYNIIYDIKSILHDLLKYYNEIYNFLIYENADLNYDLNTCIFLKSTIFNVWHEILSLSNDLHYEQKKVLYIPNYNFILFDTKPVSKCSQEEINCYLKILAEDKTSKKSHIRNAYLKYKIDKEDHKKDNPWFDYIPVIAEEKYELKNNSYILQLNIPDDIEYIQNFINLTDKAIIQLKNNIEQCKKIIEDYTLQEKRELLSLILDSCNEIKK